MKCKAKDCKDCVHFANIQTHPLFADMQIQTEDGKPIRFEGCIFHLQTMFTMQLWKRQIGVQAAIESSRNDNQKHMRLLINNIGAAAQIIQGKELPFPHGLRRAIDG